MGIIKRGILGGFSNKVANVVGSSWKGRAVIKALPLSVANPRTTPQVNQRTKFKAASQFFSPILSGWVKPLWDRFAGNISGYNAIVKENTENFSNAGVPDYPNLVMSKGKMVPPIMTSVQADVSSEYVTVVGEMPEDSVYGQDDSEFLVLGYDTVTGKQICRTGLVYSPGDPINVTVQAENLVLGNAIGVYTAIRRADLTQVSDSVYTTGTTVA